MEKYEKMVELNKQRSREKIDRAKREIREMVSKNEEITVAELVKRTGLSRIFFYNNQEVAQSLAEARKLQNGKTFIKPQKIILDKAMERELLKLQKKLDKLETENSQLSEQNKKLKTALNRKELYLLKNL